MFKMRKDKKIELSMRQQIQEAIDKIKSTGERLDDTVATPVTNKLFFVNKDCEKLDKEKSEIFHSVTAKVLFITKRVRPDLETTVAFLCTRVSKSDLDNWKKLKQMMGFLKRAIDDVRIIGATSLTDVYTWIDAAYTVHNNMLSQTGGAMSMGHGILHGRSSKQKLNTKNSTKAELVGMSEYIPYNIWFLHFFAHQGYKISKNILYQDNQSTIHMEKNGCNSCTSNSRHIDIRYFL